MILNLLNTMLITLGTGTSVLTMPKKQINPPINRATETNYTLDLTLGTNQTQQSTGQIGSSAGGQISTKREISGNNTFLNVIGTSYTQAVNYTALTPNTGVTYIAGSYTYIAQILKITPYYINLETQRKETINCNVTIDIDAEEEVTWDLTLVRTTYITTQNWDTYIGNNNFGSWLYLYDIKQEIENPEMGYVYQKQTQNYTINYQGQDINTSYDITLTTNTDLYVYTFYNITSDYWVASGSYAFPMQLSNNIQITGKGLIPEGTTEIVDIPGLMFNILTMPFTFISAAFNLTLFPGTPYQINISNLFMAIIAVMAFIFILKLLIGLKGGN